MSCLHHTVKTTPFLTAVSAAPLEDKTALLNSKEIALQELKEILKNDFPENKGFLLEWLNTYGLWGVEQIIENAPWHDNYYYTEEQEFELANLLKPFGQLILPKIRTIFEKSENYWQWLLAAELLKDNLPSHDFFKLLLNRWSDFITNGNTDAVALGTYWRYFNSSQPTEDDIEGQELYRQFAKLYITTPDCYFRDFTPRFLAAVPEVEITALLDHLWSGAVYTKDFHIAKLYTYFDILSKCPATYFQENRNQIRTKIVNFLAKTYKNPAQEIDFIQMFHLDQTRKINHPTKNSQVAWREKEEKHGGRYLLWHLWHLTEQIQNPEQEIVAADDLVFYLFHHQTSEAMTRQLWEKVSQKKILISLQKQLPVMQRDFHQLARNTWSEKITRFLTTENQKNGFQNHELPVSFWQALVELPLPDILGHPQRSQLLTFPVQYYAQRGESKNCEAAFKNMLDYWQKIPVGSRCFTEEIPFSFDQVSQPFFQEQLRQEYQNRAAAFSNSVEQKHFFDRFFFDLATAAQEQTLPPLISGQFKKNFLGSDYLNKTLNNTQQTPEFNIKKQKLYWQNEIEQQSLTPQNEFDLINQLNLNAKKVKLGKEVLSPENQRWRQNAYRQVVERITKNSNSSDWQKETKELELLFQREDTDMPTAQLARRVIRETKSSLPHLKVTRTKLSDLARCRLAALVYLNRCQQNKKAMQLKEN